jgi:DNA-binding NtrC family response regulator
MAAPWRSLTAARCARHAGFERQYIAAVLEQYQGRLSDAAKALGIQRTKLYRTMRSLRVTRERRAKR